MRRTAAPGVVKRSYAFNPFDQRSCIGRSQKSRTARLVSSLCPVHTLYGFTSERRLRPATYLSGHRHPSCLKKRSKMQHEKHRHQERRDKNQRHCPHREGRNLGGNSDTQYRTQPPEGYGNNEVQHPKEVPDPKERAGRKGRPSSEGEYYQGSGNTDCHVTESGWPGK